MLVLTQEENKAIDTTGLPADPPNYTHCRILSRDCGEMRAVGQVINSDYLTIITEMQIKTKHF